MANILLGITGGIAAYKTPELVRLLIKMGHSVRCVLSESATHFVTPLTLQTLSSHELYQDLMSADLEAGIGHINLARWPDLIVIAPATANCMAKLTHGLADDLLSTLCLATDRTIAIAPAMNRLMWENAATQANLQTLQSRGVHIWGPASGEQACGEKGLGRMLEPPEIADKINQTL